MEKQCPKCGELIPETAKFCSRCGTQLEDIFKAQDIQPASKDVTQLIDEPVPCDKDETQMASQQLFDDSFKQAPFVQGPILDDNETVHVPVASEVESQVLPARRSHTWLYIIIGILSVALISGAAGYAWYWWSNKKKSAKKAAVERLWSENNNENSNDDFLGDNDDVVAKNEDAYLLENVGEAEAEAVAAEAPAKTAGVAMVVFSGTDIHLRVSPSTSSGWLTWSDGTTRSIPDGGKLEYAGDYGDWYAVKYDGRQLYVSKQFTHLSYGCAPSEVYSGSGTHVAKAAAPHKSSASSSKSGVVINGDGVRMRFYPSYDSDWLKWSNGQTRSVSKGARLEYVDDYGDWYAVKYQGYTLYVSKDYSYRVD